MTKTNKKETKVQENTSKGAKKSLLVEMTLLQTEVIYMYSKK